ncbi:MAG TPA: hypothetical protein VH092_36985 [Urbifossiella sp.]|nr:hypothetical protein [Urbifossiella sp.]
MTQSKFLYAAAAGFAAGVALVFVLWWGQEPPPAPADQAPQPIAPEPPRTAEAKATAADADPLKRGLEAIQARLKALPDGMPSEQRSALEKAEREALHRINAKERADLRAKMDRLGIDDDLLFAQPVPVPDPVAKEVTPGQSLPPSPVPPLSEIPTVTATLAVDVTFPDDAREPVAVAALDLVYGAADVTSDVPAAAWDAALRGCHVRLHFPGRPYPGGQLGTSGITELLVPLPLDRDPGGFVLARGSSGRIVRYSKSPPDVCARLQEALAAAVPAAARR